MRAPGVADERAADRTACVRACVREIEQAIAKRDVAFHDWEMPRGF